MTKHTMRHVFRADVKDQDGVWDGVWFETDEYTRDSAEADEYDGDGMSVYDATLIWASNGKDEDYMYGYTEDELERAI